MQISQLVRVRSQRWRIAGVRVYEGCQLVTLTAATPSLRGNERQVLAPFDDIEPLAENPRPRFVSARAWWRACRAAIAEHAPPGSLRTVHRAAVDLLPHQLEPALAIIRGLGSRVLLADEVGLGKTIQAGIIVSELQARSMADRILVLTPAGLRDQWMEELSTRFGLDARLADAAGLRRLAATLPLGVNPWITSPVAVASLDYVKRSDVLPAVLACDWDVVIIDEAHGAAGDSERRAASAALAARAGYVLLLTATPHSGDTRTFRSLCQIGAAGDDLLVFRRRRLDVRTGARRRVHALHVRSSAEELRVQAALDRYVAAVRAEHPEACLAAAVLHKRALSSAWSLARSVERRLEALATRDPLLPARQMALPLGDPEGETSPADEEPAWPAELGLTDPEREARLLRALLASASSAAARESKLLALARMLRRTREAAIVFTEYRDTLRHVRAALAVPAAVLHGGMTRAERAAAVADFVCGRRSLLLATDAGSEGLNLHHACRLVINLELPWNPVRLEQRIGRVDRIGQRRTVHAVHLIAEDTAERRILARLQARIARASAEIGAADPLATPGHDEERAAAQFVVLGIDEPPPAGRFDDPGYRIMPELRAAALEEARRLSLARSLLDAQGRSPRPIGRAAGPWIVRARRAALRATLGRRVLMLWRMSCEDGCGRPLESALLPLIIDVARAPDCWATAAVDELRREVESRLARASRQNHESAAEAVADWHAAASAAVHALFEARLERERAVNAHGDSRQPFPLQSGLFDRRAARARLAAAATSAEADADRRNRMARIESAAAMSPAPPRVVLILVP